MAARRPCLPAQSATGPFSLKLIVRNQIKEGEGAVIPDRVHELQHKRLLRSLFQQFLSEEQRLQSISFGGKPVGPDGTGPERLRRFAHGLLQCADLLLAPSQRLYTTIPMRG